MFVHVCVVHVCVLFDFVISYTYSQLPKGITSMYIEVFNEVSNDVIVCHMTWSVYIHVCMVVSTLVMSYNGTCNLCFICRQSVGVDVFI